MDFGDWLARQNAGQVTGLAAVTGGILIAIIAIVSGVWSRARRAESRARQVEAELALKQEMIERGMSADDIERVLKAGQASAAPSRCSHDEEHAEAHKS